MDFFERNVGDVQCCSAKHTNLLVFIDSNYGLYHFANKKKNFSVSMGWKFGENKISSLGLGNYYSSKAYGGMGPQEFGLV